MKLIDAVLYTLLLVGWLCGAYIASVTHFEIFILLGFAVSGFAFLWLGIKSIYRMTTKKDTEFIKESTIYKCIACGHITPFRTSECPKCGGITTKQMPYRAFIGDEKEE